MFSCLRIPISSSNQKSAIVPVCMIPLMLATHLFVIFAYTCSWVFYNFYFGTCVCVCSTFPQFFALWVLWLVLNPVTSASTVADERLTLEDTGWYMNIRMSYCLRSFSTPSSISFDPLRFTTVLADELISPLLKRTLGICRRILYHVKTSMPRSTWCHCDGEARKHCRKHLPVEMRVGAVARDWPCVLRIFHESEKMRFTSIKLVYFANGI